VRVVLNNIALVIDNCDCVFGTAFLFIFYLYSLIHSTDPRRKENKLDIEHVKKTHTHSLITVYNKTSGQHIVGWKCEVINHHMSYMH
jgi:hypothetical protein